ncbi:hypothetical protein ACWKSP_32810 [Micromonosporaceae bacterium Da 78-11]
MTSEELRRFACRVADEITDHLVGLPERAVFTPYPRDLLAALDAEAMPRDGAGADAVLADFRRFVAPFPFGNGPWHGTGPTG